MTGDVLPCFDAFSMVLPEDAASIVTVPITLDIASNHGVIVASKIGLPDEKSSVYLVENLLQKPNIEDLVEHQAILDDGRTLLDTGIIAVKGKAWVDLVMLACSSQPLISELLQSKKEASELVLWLFVFSSNLSDCCMSTTRLLQSFPVSMFWRLQHLSFLEPFPYLLPCADEFI